MIKVKLSYAQISMAAHVAVMRRLMNLQRGVPPRYGADNSWEGDIAGCIAELAVAQYLNKFWCGTVGNREARDVGGLVDVRSCAPDRRLILHPHDPDEVPFVLAWSTVTTLPYVDLVGWLYASEGKQQRWWQDPTGRGRDAFFVPHEQLRDMEELPAQLRQMMLEDVE